MDSKMREGRLTITITTSGTTGHGSEWMRDALVKMSTKLQIEMWLLWFVSTMPNPGNFLSLTSSVLGFEGKGLWRSSEFVHLVFSFSMRFLLWNSTSFEEHCRYIRAFLSWSLTPRCINLFSNFLEPTPTNVNEIEPAYVLMPRQFSAIISIIKGVH